MKEFFASRFGVRILAAVSMLSILIVAYRIYANRITPEKILAGKVLFEHEWTPDDPLANQGDGLGPVFNDVSCVACHFQGGTGGAGPNTKNVTKFLVLPTADRSTVYRGVIHKHAIDESQTEKLELVQDLFPDIPGETRRQGCYTIVEPPINPVLETSINTPALFGLGLIEKIPSYAISFHGSSKMLSTVADEFRGKFSSQGIGRIKMSGTTVGKFGWKGEFGTIEDFVAEACAVELGLSVPGRGQDIPQEFSEDRSAKYDLNRRQLHELVCFVKSLPRPEQLLPTDPHERRQVEIGETVFAEVGCAECHVPDIGGVEGIYTDFHLYNLSSPDTDIYSSVLTNDKVKFPLAETAPNEWKTPPLWGVADSAPYFHDGSADDLEAAINLHRGDAEFSRKAYLKAGNEKRAALIAFLKTLKAPVLAE